MLLFTIISVLCTDNNKLLKGDSDIFSRSNFFSAICDGKIGDDACTKNYKDDEILKRNGTEVRDSGGNCSSPGNCTNCNDGFYVDGPYCESMYFFPIAKTLIKFIEGELQGVFLQLMQSFLNKLNSNFLFCFVFFFKMR